jgi:predicted nucleic acid-binding protein
LIHFDSAFLIDLQREITRERPGPAFDFIEPIGDSEIFCVSVHVICELRTGVELSRRALREQEELDRFLSGFQVMYPDDRFAPLFARLRAAITRSKQHLADMDLLIATAALLDDAPIVTKNVKDFSRVPGLRVLGY